MTYSIVQTAHNNGTGTTASVTTAATGAGNLLFALVAAVRNPGTDTITTPSGWSLIGAVQDDPTFVEFTAGLYYLPNTTAGLTSFSWTLGTAPLQWDILLLEISGAATTAPLDVSAVHNQQVNHTSDTVSATTTVAGDLLLGVGLWDSAETGAPPGSLSDGTGWTSVATFSDAPGWMTLHIADQTQAAAGSATYAPTWTGTQDDIVWLVAFKPAAGGGSTPLTAQAGLMVLNPPAAAATLGVAVALAAQAGTGVLIGPSAALSVAVALTAPSPALGVLIGSSATLALGGQLSAQAGLMVLAPPPSPATLLLAVALVSPAPAVAVLAPPAAPAALLLAVPLNTAGAVALAVLVGSSATLIILGVVIIGAASVSDTAVAGAALSDTSVGGAALSDALIGVAAIGDV